MSFAYTALAVVTSLIVAASGMMKVRLDPKVTKIIHDVVGVPLRFFPFLAASEFAGAIGLLGGIFWVPLGVAASAALVLYFVGALLAHVRVGDWKGLSPQRSCSSSPACACCSESEEHRGT
jgi:DoxX-like family